MTTAKKPEFYGKWEKANAIRKMAPEARVCTPEVKQAFGDYVSAASTLGNYGLRVLEYLIGGKDDVCLVAFQDRATHKPFVCDLSGEDD